MVRHEVPLLYWEQVKTTGAGAESHGRLIKQLHRLGGGIPVGNLSRTLFIEADTLRKCIYGFLARQRRKPNRPCPSCPRAMHNGQWVSLCKTLTTDAKRLSIPVRFHDGTSPDQTNDASPTIDAQNGCIADRMYWPGKAMVTARALGRGLAAAVLGRQLKLRKGEPEFKFRGSAGNELISLAPRGYGEAIRLV